MYDYSSTVNLIQFIMEYILYISVKNTVIGTEYTLSRSKKTKKTILLLVYYVSYTK